MKEPRSLDSIAREQKKADLRKTRAETMGLHLKNCTEAVKSLGIVIALVLSAWANFTKASNDEVERVSEKAENKFDTVAEDLEMQHEQTEKIRETVEGTTKALKTAVSASPASQPPGIRIQDEEPDETGCWTVYGGIVRCKGLEYQDMSNTVTSDGLKMDAVEVPDPPPPAPKPKAATKTRRSTRD